jgi:hypothetical protein
MSVTSDVVDALVLPAVHEYGDHGLLFEFDSTAEVLAWTAKLQETDLLGVVDIVPASRTILVKLASPRYQPGARQRLSKLRLAPESVVPEPASGKVDLTIDVVYDGADLQEVAALTGLTPAGVIAAHTGTPVAGRIRRVCTRFRIPGGRRPAATGPPAAPSRAPACRPEPSRWPASSAVSIRGSHRAAGS